MWTRDDLKAFLARQRSAEEASFADTELAAEFANARRSWDGVLEVAARGESGTQWEEARSRLQASWSSSQGER